MKRNPLLQYIIVKKSHLKQCLRIMRISLILLFACAFHIIAVNTEAQNIKIELSSGNISVRQLLSEIEKQTDYLVLFRNSDVDISRTVRIKNNSDELTSYLDAAFKNTDIHYEFQNKYIVLSKKNSPPENALQQVGRTITGKVMDEQGEPVVGANVVEKGTTNGVITDIDGNFSLMVLDNAALLFSYIGYIPLEILVKDQTNLRITLKEDFQALDEVVVVGYGTMKKRDLTGAVSHISADQMSYQVAMKDPLQYLQGKVPGVDITIGNAPGATSTIAIRGYNSLKASNSPLIVVDDVPFNGRLDEINSSEIEKMDILKDASSTAIYGSRGANGVIIITTKRAPKEGRISINYDGYYGISKSFKNFDMMSAEKYADYKRATHYGKPDEEIFDPIQLNAIRNGEYVDWQDEVFGGTGYKTDHNVTISQSNSKNRNLVVLGYNKDQSIIDNMGFQRFSLRTNGDMELAKGFSMGYSLSLSHTKRDNGDNSVWRFGTVLDPLTQIYDEKGNMRFFPSGWYESQRHSNPLFDVDYKNVDNQTKRIKALCNLFAHWEIIKGLSFRTSFTYDVISIRDGQYYSPTSQNRQMQAPYASLKKTTQNQMTFTNILNYANIFDRHKIEASFVHDMQKYDQENVGLTGADMPYYGSWYNVNEAPDIFSRNAGYNEWALLSFMGRVNYTFNDRYMLTLTGRYDGSSRLAPGNKWDFFPSIALGWRINEENFMKSVDWVSNLKLRLSWGNTGNTAIDTYATQGALKRYPYFFGNDQSAIGYLPSELPNKDLGWEKTEEYNIGLDFGVLQNRISGSVDLYQRNTTDLLMPRNLPVTSGYVTTWQNIGKTRNSGVEININAIPLRLRDFRWTVDFSFGYNKNQILELFNGKDDSPGNNWFIGKPFNIERLYYYDGVWQTSEAEEAKVYGRSPGDPKVKDVNQNGQYDQEDLYILNKIPKWTAGLSTGVFYKNFDLNIYLYARQKYGARLGVLTTEAGSSRTNHLDVDFWTPDNPTNESPKPRISNSQDLLVNSDYSFRDLSFVRLKNINLGYTFNKSITEKICAKRLRVYFSVDNPYVWTKKDYVGLDPENCNSYTDHRPLTSFILGVNVGF